MAPEIPGLFLRETKDSCDPLVRCASIRTAFSMAMGGHKHDQETHSCHQYHCLRDLISIDRIIREKNAQAKSSEVQHGCNMHRQARY